MADPTRPASSTEVIKGPSSRAIERPTRLPMKSLAPKSDMAYPASERKHEADGRKLRIATIGSRRVADHVALLDEAGPLAPAAAVGR